MERSSYHSCSPPHPTPPLFKSGNHPLGSTNFLQSPCPRPCSHPGQVFCSCLALPHQSPPLLPSYPPLLGAFPVLGLMWRQVVWGTGGENGGMPRVTIGQALSRRHGAPPLTLEPRDWGRPREAVSFPLWAAGF